MINICVDSFTTAAEVRKFIRNSLSTFGCVSLDEILYVAGYQYNSQTYNNILFYKEAEQTSIMPIYSERSKGYKLIIPYNNYTMTFDCTNKNDSTTKAEILSAADKIKLAGITASDTLIPKSSPKPANYLPEIKNVKFNGPATIVFWADGTKTVVKCQDGDDYSEEVGLAMCIAKKVFGNTSKYNDIFKKWCNSYDTETDTDDYLSEVYKQFRDHVLKTFNEII